MVKVCGYFPLGFSEFGFSHSLGHKRTFAIVTKPKSFDDKLADFSGSATGTLEELCA